MPAKPTHRGTETNKVAGMRDLAGSIEQPLPHTNSFKPGQRFSSAAGTRTPLVFSMGVAPARLQLEVAVVATDSIIAVADLVLRNVGGAVIGHEHQVLFKDQRVRNLQPAAGLRANLDLANLRTSDSDP